MPGFTTTIHAPRWQPWKAMNSGADGKGFETVDTRDALFVVIVRPPPVGLPVVAVESWGEGLPATQAAKVLRQLADTLESRGYPR
jgi:hypothetical protein